MKLSRRQFLRAAAAASVTAATASLAAPAHALSGGLPRLFPGGAEPDFQALDERVREAQRRLQVPGVAIGVISAGREHAAGFGVTSVENPLPVDADTLFQVGSITKTFTATAAVKLAESGSLDLDAPVRTYLPDLRLADEATARNVTTRHLLSHSGGWSGDFFADTGRGDDALERYVGRMTTLPQLTPLGSTFAYSNSGFSLAGRVIEAVTDQPYERAVQRLVLDPLELRRSFWFASEVMTSRFAVGHRLTASGPEVQRVWQLPRAINPAGGAITSVRDLLRFARVQLSGGRAPDGRVYLPVQTLANTWVPWGPSGTLDDPIAGAGAAWLLPESWDVHVVQHTGATVGQFSSLTIVPAGGFAVAVLTNADSGMALHREITAWSMQRYLGLQRNDPKAVNLPAHKLAAYAGAYLNADGAGFRLVSQGDGMIAHEVRPAEEEPLVARSATPLATLGFEAEDRAFIVDPPLRGIRADFLRGLDGAVTWFRFGGRLYARQSGA